MFRAQYLTINWIGSDPELVTQMLERCGSYGSSLLCQVLEFRAPLQLRPYLKHCSRPQAVDIDL